MEIDWNNPTPEESRKALEAYERDKRRYNTRSMLRGKWIKLALQGQSDMFRSEEDRQYWEYMANLLRSWAEEDPWIKERIEKVELIG
jgi:hypothetical protein